MVIFFGKGSPQLKGPPKNTNWKQTIIIAAPDTIQSWREIQYIIYINVNIHITDVIAHIVFIKHIYLRSYIFDRYKNTTMT